MLIDISIKNYLSFKDEITFSLLAGSGKEFPNNYYTFKKQRILKTAIIYGPNANGKSNLLKAVNFVREIIVNSWNIGPNDLILGFPNSPLQPFRLNDKTRSQPSEFEINFIINETPYRYYFSLDNKKIHREELYSYKTQKAKKLFIRNFQDIEIYDFEDNKLKNTVLENNLALSVFAKGNSPEARLIHNFFFNINVFFKSTAPFDTFEMIKSDETNFKPFLMNLLKNADLGIDDISYKFKKINLEDLPVDIQKIIGLAGSIDGPLEGVDWRFSHTIYNDLDNKLGKDEFVEQDESDGTKKIFHLAGSLYNVMNQGKILFIDEFEDSLHPLLQEVLINSIHNSKYEKNFQFIFTTHNTNLMDIQNIFRRDQIWFVEKDKYSNSRLYGLSEFKDSKTRKDTVLEKNYLSGRYGALPFIQVDNLFSEEFDNER